MFGVSFCPPLLLGGCPRFTFPEESVFSVCSSGEGDVEFLGYHLNVAPVVKKNWSSRASWVLIWWKYSRAIGRMLRFLSISHEIPVSILLMNPLLFPHVPSSYARKPCDASEIFSLNRSPWLTPIFQMNPSNGNEFTMV